MKHLESQFRLHPLVYIETTVFSFHDTYRTQPEMLAMRNWTREWWQTNRHDYKIVSSVVVLDELERGSYENKEKALAMALDIEMLSVSDEVLVVAEEYKKRHLMPKEMAGDALHLALASYYGCQYLLTWNCKHLANTRKQEHIRHVNTMLGLMAPIITTPMELL